MLRTEPFLPEAKRRLPPPNPEKGKEMRSNAEKIGSADIEWGKGNLLLAKSEYLSALWWKREGEHIPPRVYARIGAMLQGPESADGDFDGFNPDEYFRAAYDAALVDDFPELAILEVDGLVQWKKEKFQGQEVGEPGEYVIRFMEERLALGVSAVNPVVVLASRYSDRSEVIAA